MLCGNMVQRLQAYHKRFQGDAYDLCAICGGICERHLISCLLPGESQLIADYLKISQEDFRVKFTDSIVTDEGVVDVLRLCTRCPFIDSTCRCTIGPVKPVMCDIYPVDATVDEAGRVHFRLDPDCPLTHFQPAVDFFTRECIPALEELGADTRHYAAIESFDFQMYDFERFAEIRNPSGERLVCELPEILERAVNRRPGKLAIIFENLADPKVETETELSDPGPMLDMLRQSNQGNGQWTDIIDQCQALQAYYPDTEDAEYLVAIQHLAGFWDETAIAAQALHRAVAQAALNRIPENQTGTALYNWLEKSLGG